MKLPKKLIILESPGKIKSFKKYAGEGYNIVASYGHIFDLPERKIGVNIKKDFEPTFVIKDDKQGVFESILSLAKQSDTIYLFMDEDREGEGIAKNIRDALLTHTKASIHRATTNEITAKGIKAALASPGDINNAKVESYLARRILDRLAGYKTSYLTQQATGGRSAGRVQSAILRIIVEREIEIKNFKPVEYWVLTAHFISSKGDPYIGVLTDKIKIPDKKTATEYYDKIIGGSPVVTSVESKDVAANPYPPFITSTMQQSASVVFGWSASKTMQVAQDLYNGGLCLVPGELLVIDDGSIKEIEAINPTYSVMGFDENNKVRRAKVTRQQQLWYDDDIYDIRTLDGQEISVTSDHKIRCLSHLNNGKLDIVWKEAKNIELEDKVLCSKTINVKREHRDVLLYEFVSQLSVEHQKRILVGISSKERVWELLNKHKSEISKSAYYKYKKQKRIPFIWTNTDDAIDVEYYLWATPSSKPEFYNSEQFCYFLGLCLGDGYISRSKIVFPSCIMGENKWQSLLSGMGKNVASDKASVNVSGQILRHLCMHFGGREEYKADRIFVHHFISSLPVDLICKFLAGLFDSDGCIQLYEYGSHMSYTTISQKMAKGMNLLLRTIGVLSGIHRRKGDQKNCTVKISRSSVRRLLLLLQSHALVKSEHIKDILNRLPESISQTENLPIIEWIEESRISNGLTKQRISKALFGDSTTYWNYLRLLPGRTRPSHVPKNIVKKAAEFLGSPRLYMIADSDVYFASIKEIKKKPYCGWVYDITTTTSNFICNTIFSHNCTYHRTDSPFMADEATQACRAHIQAHEGEEYLHSTIRTFRAKKGAQEAHECCRVTDICQQTLPISGDHARLYDMIWRRTVATQMSSGQDRRTKVVTAINRYDFISHGNVVIFDGFRKIWTFGKGKEANLPMLTEGEKIILKALEEEQKFTQAPPRYSDASLSKRCEDAQISRPATFANFLKTLESRGYIQRVKKVFHATELGIKVIDFLIAANVCFVDIKFTSDMEELLDQIQEKTIDKLKVLQDFWDRLKCDIENGKKIKQDQQVTDFKCPKCGGCLLLKHSKFGPFFICSHMNRLTKKQKDEGMKPECDYIANVGETGEPIEKTAKKVVYLDFRCSKCKSKMVERNSKYGVFAGCSSFPACRMIADLEGNFKEPSKKKGRKKSYKKSYKKSSKKRSGKT